MRMQEFDVVVVGGGVSGLRAAIAARQAGARVALLSKVHPLRSHSAVAQGGLNAPLGRDDSPEAFAEDTLIAGDGLSNREVVNAFVREASEAAVWLDRMGTPFNRDGDGRLDLCRFGSNTHNRTCYADDRTGHIVLQVLHEQFTRAQIPSFEEWFVTSLVVDDGVCLGVIALGLRTGKLEAFASRAVVLATGSFTYLYHPSTASLGTTGDGQSLAYLSGARLMDMEMVQYHPTVMPGNRALLITEATLGEGAEVVNSQCEAILTSKALPRQKICLAIHEATQDQRGPAFLDLRPLGKERLLSRFPQTHELVRLLAGLDVTKEPVPILPVPHRTMGGIETDARGETSIAGLYAVGECASNGLNGAGRLAGNTLAESVVFGRRAGEAAAGHADGSAKKTFPLVSLSDGEKRLTAIVGRESTEDSAGKIHSELAGCMSEKAGLIREASGLTETLERLLSLKNRYRRLGVRNSSRIYNYELTSYLELGSMLNLAELVVEAARTRTESRGAHRRSDFPTRNDENWQAHTIVTLREGAPRWEKKPAALS